MLDCGRHAGRPGREFDRPVLAHAGRVAGRRDDGYGLPARVGRHHSGELTHTRLTWFRV